MAQETVGGTDKLLGLSIVLGAIAVAGAITMLIAPGISLGAVGFAIAIVAGLALVALLHVSV